MSKRCIVLSQGPVPTPEHKTVEGGGLRCWGLAQGLVGNERDVEVAVAYHESYRQDDFTEIYEGVHLATWNIDTIGELIAGYDTVIVSYCMGDLSVKVADLIRPDQQLVLDCYVPIYVEVSARQSSDLDSEYRAFNNDVSRWAHVLRRGDLFLCSSPAQQKYYQGVLSALGRVNPITYNEELILVVPYGIYRELPKATKKPISKLVDKKFKKILWFGGIYPWFDLRNLVEAAAIVNRSVPSKLVIVGAKNPFNTHPDFVRRYEELIEFINSKPAYKDMVVLQDWVRFEDRANWYLDSDLVVVINKEGDENALAWRTRLVDFMWADLPIVTNGGDPLGELLIENKAAARIVDLESSALAKDIASALAGGSKLSDMQKNLARLKADFYWDAVTAKLANKIKIHSRAADLEQYGSLEVVHPASSARGKIAKVAYKLKSLPAYHQKYGTLNTIHAIKTTASKQAARVKRKLGVASETDSAKVVFIAHQLDMSGAPFVFMDLAKYLRQTNPRLPLEFHTFNPTHPDNLKELNAIGVKPKLHISKDVAIDFANGDVAVLNTVGHSRILKDSIYGALESGRLKRLVWYIHEDEPELIFDSGEKKRIKQLLNTNKITIYAAAVQTVEHYREFFDNSSAILVQPYNFVVPSEFRKIRAADDFDKLSFILPGTVGDGRKGQMPVLYAFKAFLEQYYRDNPKSYRDFELVFVGMSDDFLSRQILRHAKNLGKRFKHHQKVTHERSSELIMQSNVTICYSMRECLPLFVFEGMAAGHPILRNECSGVEEQLVDGKNGLRLDTNDYEGLIAAIERVLNRSKTSNQALADMSKLSNKIAMQQADHSYEPMVTKVLEAYGQ